MLWVECQCGDIHHFLSDKNEDKHIKETKWRNEILRIFWKEYCKKEVTRRRQIYGSLRNFPLSTSANSSIIIIGVEGRSFVSYGRSKPHKEKNKDRYFVQMHMHKTVQFLFFTGFFNTDLVERKHNEKRVKQRKRKIERKLSFRPVFRLFSSCWLHC